MERKKTPISDPVFQSKIKKSIDRLKLFEPEEGYYLAFSGGKDSQCIYHLALMAGVKFKAEYRVTTVDPPELVRFIKKQYPEVKISVPHDKDGKPITMWNLIVKNGMPPTRLARYCCAKLKESGGVGMVTVTGVRWAESSNRKNNQGAVNIRTKSKELYSQAEMIDGAEITKRGSIIMNEDNDEARRFVEQCFRTRKTLVNPIIDWEDSDVWAFLDDVAKVPHCELYDQGYNRLGCIGCPMNTHRREELDKYSKYRDNYMRAFDRMLTKRIESGKLVNWNTPQEVMDWWLQ